MTNSASILGRFRGPSGQQRLVTVMKQQELVEGDTELARRFVSSGTLVEFVKGETLCEQGGCDTDVYFILDGEVDISVHCCHVRSRLKGSAIGEWAALDPTAHRSAKVCAATYVAALKVPGDAFVEAVQSSRELLGRVFRQAGEEIRKRGALHRAPNPKPILFIGSSSESRHIAESMALGLTGEDIEPRVWTHDVFAPSSTAMEDLLRQSDEVDFAALVLAPDDQLISRGTLRKSPRNNVVFELGLFMGALGRGRTFMIQNRAEDLVVPSDLSGVTHIPYSDLPSGSLSDNLSPVCASLRKLILHSGSIVTRMNLPPARG